MPITVSGTSITFNDSTTQTTAFTGGGVTSLNGQTGAITNTSYNAIGSYVAAFLLGGSTSASAGGTYAGSSLRNRTNGNENTPFSVYNFQGETYANLGQSGTWRAMAPSRNSNVGCDGNYVVCGTLYVRIS